jgi:hypothetical protein
MAADTPTIEPTRIVAGDTLKFTITLADYSASDGWTLTYTMVNASARQTFAAAADGSDHAVTVAAATTAAWAVGSYDWIAKVSNVGGEVYTVRSGRWEVASGFTSATDARTHARTMLDAIEAVLEGRATSAVQEYEIAGRKLRYIPLPELLVIRDKYRAEVAREDAAADVARGMPDGRRVYVRFGR